MICAASSTKEKPRGGGGKKASLHTAQWVGGDKRGTSSGRSRMNGNASETKKKKKKQIGVDVTEPKHSDCVMKIEPRVLRWAERGVKQERRIIGPALPSTGFALCSAVVGYLYCKP